MKTRTAILTVIVIGLCSALTAWTQEHTANKPGTVQQQAWTYFLQARQGDAPAAEKAVKLLEEGVAANPDDASLWTLLGRGYFMKLSTLGRTGGGLDELVATIQRATDAYSRALERDSNDTNALSGHGMALTILGGFQRKQDAMAKGIQEMNRAVEMNPKANPPRLARGFTMVNFPAPIRSTPAVIEDLSMLIQNAGGHNQRAVDSLHIMLGDVYSETGKTDQARVEYEAAASTSSSSREQAQSRLAALQQGSVPAADIASLRSALGTSCTMCHAQ